jgi:hypothetical protein
MKRNTLLLTTAAIAIGAVVASASLAQGPGPGMMQGQGPGPDMMQGQGMMQGHGQFKGMMQGHGYGPGSGDCQYGQTLETPLTIDDVRANLQKHLEWRGNDRLKVGTVVETDANTITAEIVTVDDSLVRKIQIDKTTGRHIPVN